MFSAGDYSVEDFQNCIERVAQALLRKRLRFEDATLFRLITEVADHAARNARSSIKGLLLQLEHHATPHGLAEGFRAPLAAMLHVLERELRAYAPQPVPQICREVGDRTRALLGKIARPATRRR